MERAIRATPAALSAPKETPPTADNDSVRACLRANGLAGEKVGVRAGMRTHIHMCVRLLKCSAAVRRAAQCMRRAHTSHHPTCTIARRAAPRRATPRHTTPHHGTPRHTTPRHDALGHGMVRHCPALSCVALQHGTAPHSAALRGAALFRTALHRTALQPCVRWCGMVRIRRMPPVCVCLSVPVHTHVDTHFYGNLLSHTAI